MREIYHEKINKIAEVLLDEIEKHFPGITKRNYDGCGFPNIEGSPALSRAKACLYIELMKAGVFNHELDFTEKS